MGIERYAHDILIFINRASRLFSDIHKKGIANKSLKGLFIKFLKRIEEIKKFDQPNDNICKLLIHKVTQLS